MSKLVKWVLIILVIVTLTIAGLLIGLNIWAQEVFYVSIYLAVLCFGSVIALKIWSDREVDKEANADLKRKWDYSMKACAEMTQRALGGVSLQWRQGRGRSSSEKYFKIGMKQIKYYVFDAVMSETREPVMVFWDCDNENIGGFFSNPTQEMYADPFKNFKPTDDSNAQFMTNKFMKNQRAGTFSNGFTISPNGSFGNQYDQQPQQDELEEEFMNDVNSRIQS